MATKVLELSGIGTVSISKRSGQKSIRISISGGKIKVSQPSWLPYSAGEAFAHSRREWIAEHIEGAATKTYKQGQQIGESRLLVIEFGAKRSSRVTDDLVIVGLASGEDIASSGAQSYIAAAANRSLRRDAEKTLPPRLKSLAEIHGFTYKSVKIKSLKRRWGSCTTHKDIALNQRLVELTQAHIDYVLLHELVHTEQMNHGEMFWSRLEQVYPNAKGTAKIVRRLQP
jgi:predicted metal-dependent hydrolase